MLREPPAVARCQGAGLREGAQVSVRLTRVDEVRREVEFAYGGPAE